MTDDITPSLSPNELAKLDALEDAAMIGRIAHAIERAVTCRRIQIRVGTNDAIRLLNIFRAATKVASEQHRRDRLPWYKRIIAVSRDPDR